MRRLIWSSPTDISILDFRIRADVVCPGWVGQPRGSRSHLGSRSKSWCYITPGHRIIQPACPVMKSQG